MGALQPWHVIVLAIIVILLFGAKRLPDAARSLGRSMRILKAETQGLREDDVRSKAEAQTYRQPTPPVIPPADDQPSPAPRPSDQPADLRDER
jgi:sec-independent protein translocase protein TatA